MKIALNNIDSKKHLTGGSKLRSNTPRAMSALFVLLGLAGCANTNPMAQTNAPMMSPMMKVEPKSFSQSTLPDLVKVPDGHRVVQETIGVGTITYQCRAKSNMAGQFEWVFVGPTAMLNARNGNPVGKYFGPPATWESNDGSKVTGTQVAIAPATAGNIPLQLVKANPAIGNGTMKGVAYIQRVNTKGGVAPSTPCGAMNVESNEVVKYQSDYIFYAAAQ